MTYQAVSGFAVTVRSQSVAAPLPAALLPSALPIPLQLPSNSDGRYINGATQAKLPRGRSGTCRARGHVRSCRDSQHPPCQSLGGLWGRLSQALSLLLQLLLPKGLEPPPHRLLDHLQSLCIQFLHEKQDGIEDVVLLR